MFIGHFAVGFAGKKFAPHVSLGTLFAAVQLQDLLWPLLLLAGTEHVRIDPDNTAFTPLDFYDYPVSHSLAGALLLAAMFGGAYRWLRGSWRSAAVVAAAAFSHWVLDFITHRPDLPLGFSGGPLFGLGLWNDVGATVALELTMFAAGLFLYIGCTKARGTAGRYGLAALVLVLLGIYAANIVGPPPPGVTAIAVAGNALWLLVLAGWWIDRGRGAVHPQDQER